jgi:phosphopantetheinyl transferase
MSGAVVDVWWIGLEDDADVQLLLSPEEREEAQRYVFSSHRRRFEQRRTALRVILSGYVRELPGTLRFSRRCRHCGDLRHGKPACRPATTPGSLATSRASP